MTKVSDEVAGLPLRSQVAFAAISAERALAEGAPYTKRDVRKDPLYRKALDLAWKVAGGEDLDYGREVEPIHEQVARSIPDIDAPGADEVLTYIASAVARTLFVLQAPERAAKAALGAGNATLGLMGLLYEDHDGAEKGERVWQAAAVEALRTAGNRPITRDLFGSIPDWKRGAVYKVFRKKAT